MIKIAKRNKKEFKRHNEKIDYAAFYQFGIKSPERTVIVIHAPDVQDPGDVKKAKANFKSIFNESIINDDNDANLVFDEIIKNLQPKIDFFKPLMISYSGHFRCENARKIKFGHISNVSEFLKKSLSGEHRGSGHHPKCMP